MPVWVWPAWIAVTAWCALLAADRVSALGHRVHDGWLVMRAGSVERRRDCLATAGIISWTVRQSPFQRRAEVATLVAATAAGIKRYPLIDVPEDLAWAIAAQASPWVADSIWAVAAKRSACAPPRCGPKLFAGGRGHRWTAAETTQFVVNPPVRLANSMVRRRYQRVEFAAEVTQLAVPGDRLRRGGAAVELLFLVAAQQVAHLPGIQQPGDAQVVGLFVAAGGSCGAERRAVEDDLVQFGVGAQRLETVLELGRLVLR